MMNEIPAKYRKDYGELLRQLRYLELLSRKSIMEHQITGRKFARIKDRGKGQDFSKYKMYTPGDDFRHVDWNAYARTGKLFLRIFREEPEETVYFLLDTSSSMISGDPGKVEFAKFLIVALSYISLTRGDRIRIIPFTDGGGRTAPSPWFKGMRDVFREIDWLEGMRWRGRTDFLKGLERVGPFLRKRGIVYLVSDFLEPLATIPAGLRFIMKRDLDPVLVHLFSPEEESPLLEQGASYILEDSENQADSVRLRPGTELLQEYRSRFEHHWKEIRSICRRHDISFIRTCVDRPVISFVLEHVHELGLRSLT